MKLGPLQQAVYSMTGDEVKRPVIFAGLWAIPAVWFFLNSAGLPAIGMFLCALCEMTSKNDYDNLDDLRLKYDPDYALPYDDLETGQPLLGASETAPPEELDAPTRDHRVEVLNRLVGASQHTEPETPIAVDSAQIASRMRQRQKAVEAAPSMSKIEKFCKQRQNILVVATGGAGKGIFLSNMARMRDGFTFWIDPKGDADESGYFNDEKIICYRFQAAECSGPEIVRHMRRALTFYREFCAELPDKTPVLLVFDEWFFVQTMLSKGAADELRNVEDIIIAAVSLNDAKNKHICLVVQSPKIGDILSKGGGALANFSTVSLFKDEERSYKMLEKAAECKVIPRNIAESGKLMDVCSESPRKRALYILGELIPMPELTNYACYDRDTGKFSESGDLPYITNLAVSGVEAQTPTKIQAILTNPKKETPIEQTARIVEPNRQSALEAKLEAFALKFAEVSVNALNRNEEEWLSVGVVISGNRWLKKLPSGPQRDELMKAAAKIAESKNLLQIKDTQNGKSFLVGLPEISSIESLLDSLGDQVE